MQFRDLRETVQRTEARHRRRHDGSSGSKRLYHGPPRERAPEAGLAEYVGVKHCISCGNGTDALTLALKVWNIGAGDAVFIRARLHFLLRQRSSRWKGPRPFLWMWMAIRSIWTPRIWNGR